jgi:hypothetical protein
MKPGTQRPAEDPLLSLSGGPSALHSDADRLTETRPNSLSEAPVSRTSETESSDAHDGRLRRATSGVLVALAIVAAFLLGRGAQRDASHVAPNNERPLERSTQAAMAPIEPKDTVTAPIGTAPPASPENSELPQSGVATGKSTAQTESPPTTQRGSEVTTRERSRGTRAVGTTSVEPAPAPSENSAPSAEPGGEAPSQDEPPPAVAFDTQAANAALERAAEKASTACKRPEEPSGLAVVTITFSPTGRVTTANVSGIPFAGSPVGSCIASTMRSVQIPPFSGEFITVKKSVEIR